VSLHGEITAEGRNWILQVYAYDYVIHLQSIHYYTIFIVLLFVIRFAKRGLPHTSNSMTLKDCNLGLKAHKTFYSLLTHVGLHYHPNFKTIVVFAKVGKLDVCGRPLLQIWSHMCFVE